MVMKKAYSTPLLTAMEMQLGVFGDYGDGGGSGGDDPPHNRVVHHFNIRMD
jgi:hypothetical protein